MTKTLFRVVLPVALACAVIASPASAKSKHDSDDEGACKPSVTAVGDGITSGRAHKHAIEAWKTKVSSDIGVEYADPDSAKNTSMHCHKSSVAKHDCTLKARPCKSAGKSEKHSH
jgi:hypothetical protein